MFDTRGVPRRHRRHFRPICRCRPMLFSLTADIFHYFTSDVARCPPCFHGLMSAHAVQYTANLPAVQFHLSETSRPTGSTVRMPRHQRQIDGMVIV